MIFTGFKRKTNQNFIKNHIKDFLKKQADNSKDKTKKVIIFVDEVSIITNLKKEIYKKLKISENQLEVIVYQQKASKNKIEYPTISPKNFGWYGKLKQEKFPFSLTKKYDLLINYSKIDHLYLNLLLLHMNIRFRIGFSHFDERFYDLLVNCEYQSISIFTNEIKKYLTILNKI